MSVNLVTLGMFYSLAIFAYVPDGVADPVDRPRGDRDDVPGDRLRRAHRGDAAGRRRLRLADPHPRRDPRRRRPARSSAAIGVYLVVERARARRRDRARAPPSSASSSAASSAGCSGGIGFVLAATGWWFILALWAPIYGSILNIEFFQPLAALVGSTDGLTFFASDDGIARSSRSSTIVLTSGLVALGMAGYARIQRWCLYIGLIGLAVMFVLMLVSTPGRLQGRLRPGERATCSASPTPTTRRLADAAGNDGVGSRRCPDSISVLVRHALATLAADPVHAVLDPVPELGLHALRRGPRRRVTSGRSCAACSAASGSPRAWRIVFVAPGREDVRLGLLQRDERQLHQLLLRLHDDRPDGPDLELSAAAGVLPDRQLDLPDRDGRVVRGLVPGLVGTLFLSSTRMIFAAAFDRVLPGARGPRLRARGVPVVALLLHHGPVDRPQRASTPTQSDFSGADPRRDARHRGHVPRQRDRRDDPALVEAGHLRQLAGRPPEAASSAAPG